MGKIVTEIPAPRECSLYEAIIQVNGEGFDICDKDWDWGIYMGCERDFNHCKDSDGNPDYYYACMLLFCLNIRCTKIRPEYYSVCRVSDFIKNNIDVFREFFNENNREGYRPMDYKNADDDNKDDGWYEAYMQPMESLIAGNYCQSDYEKLYLALGGTPL